MKADPALPRKQEVLLCLTAALGHAFSHQHRLKLVSLLAQNSKTVEELAEAIKQSVATTSAHLKVLRTAGVVTSRRAGRFVHYELASAEVSNFLVTLRQLAEELLPEVREIMHRFFSDPESLSQLSERELHAESKAGRIVLLDLRPEQEYVAGHLPGALHLPFAQLTDRAKALPRKGRFAAYCRGPYCLMAVEGTKRLRSLGLNVSRLRFGVAEWKAARQPLEHSSGESR